jgi:hypothetical protein
VCGGEQREKSNDAAQRKTGNMPSGGMREKKKQKIDAERERRAREGWRKDERKTHTRMNGVSTKEENDQNNKRRREGRGGEGVISWDGGSVGERKNGTKE